MGRKEATGKAKPAKKPAAAAKKAKAEPAKPAKRSAPAADPPAAKKQKVADKPKPSIDVMALARGLMAAITGKKAPAPEKAIEISCFSIVLVWEEMKSMKEMWVLNPRLAGNRNACLVYPVFSSRNQALPFSLASMELNWGPFGAQFWEPFGLQIVPT